MIRSFRGWRSRIGEALNPPVETRGGMYTPAHLRPSIDPFKGLGGPEPEPQLNDDIGDFQGSLNPAPPAPPTPYQRTPEWDRGSKSRISLPGDQPDQAGRKRSR